MYPFTTMSGLEPRISENGSDGLTIPATATPTFLESFSSEFSRNRFF